MAATLPSNNVLAPPAPASVAPSTPSNDSISLNNLQRPDASPKLEATPKIGHHSSALV